MNKRHPVETFRQIKVNVGDVVIKTCCIFVETGEK